MIPNTPRLLTAAQQFVHLRHNATCAGEGLLHAGGLIWHFSMRPTPLSRNYRVRVEYPQGVGPRRFVEGPAAARPDVEGPPQPGAAVREVPGVQHLDHANGGQGPQVAVRRLGRVFARPSEWPCHPSAPLHCAPVRPLCPRPSASLRLVHVATRTHAASRNRRSEAQTGVARRGRAGQVGRQA